MNRDDIIRMASEADDYATHATDKNKALDWYHVRDERFAALVAAAEREACAKYLDDCNEWDLAEVIRSRGEVKP